MALRHLLKKVGSPLNYLKKVCAPARASASTSAGSRHYSTAVARKRHVSSSSVGLSRGLRIGAWMRSEHVFHVQDVNDFEKRVLNSKIPTIVDFYATWCGPCKLLVPKLEQLVAKRKGQVMLAKIDIDNLTELADSYQVTAVPTVIALKNGKEVDKFVGLKDDAELETFVDKLIK